jgi:MFS family permease
MTRLAVPLPRLAALGGALFLLSYMLRSSIGPIEPELERQFDIGATHVGLLSGALFLGFALSQVPLGMAIDRLGARAVLWGAGLALAASAALFGRAASFGELVAARFFMGVASAPVYAALMAQIGARVSEARFATLAGVESGIGRIGLVLAAAPLALVYAALGWPEAFEWLALVLLAATLALGLALRGAANRGPIAPEHWRDALAGLRTVLRSRGLAAMIVFQGVAGGMAYVLLAAWGTGWLGSVYGLSASGAALRMSVCAAAYALAAPLWGTLPRVAGSERAWTIAVGAVLTLLLALPAVVVLPTGGLWLWVAALGLASGCYPLVLDQVKRSVPASLMVRGLTVLGVGSMTVGFALISASGWVVDRASGPMPRGAHAPAGFTALFAVLAATMAAGLLAYVVGTRHQSSPGSSDARSASNER